jgi:hypothetical protein
MDQRVRQSRRGVERVRKPRPERSRKRVSLIQLMSWEAEFSKSGRERVEQLGAAFCKDFEIEDARLQAANNTVARQIFGVYVVTDVRYHQNVATTHDDLAELYPGNSEAA